MDSVESLLFELILEDLKPVECEFCLGLLSLKDLWVDFDLFWGYSQDSEPSWGILFEHFMVLLWYCGLVHNLEHDLGWTFAVAVKPFSHNLIFHDHTHPLHVWIELEPSENDSLVVSLAVERKDNIRVVLREIKFELAEFKKFDFHGITDQFIRSLNLDDGVIRSHVWEGGKDVRVLWKGLLNFGLLLVLGLLQGFN